MLLGDGYDEALSLSDMKIKDNVKKNACQEHSEFIY
jgi:hypothetical protein